MGLAQPDFYSSYGPIDVNAVVQVLRLGQIQIRYMHVMHAGRNGITRIQVVSDAATDVESKSEVLSLRKLHSQRFLGVNTAKAEASVNVGSNSPARLNKIAPHSHHVGAVMGFRSARDHNESRAE